jgi:hypothetical protein
LANGSSRPVLAAYGRKFFDIHHTANNKTQETQQTANEDVLQMAATAARPGLDPIVERDNRNAANQNQSRSALIAGRLPAAAPGAQPSAPGQAVKRIGQL